MKFAIKQNIGVSNQAEVTLHYIFHTRWTFFRVKLVFECEFEMSWSLGPWDLGTLGPLPSSNTSSYFPLHPPISSTYSIPLVWFGYSSQLLQPPPKTLPTPPTSSRRVSDDWSVHTWRDFNVNLIRKVWWVGGWHCNYSYKLQVQVS